MKASCQLLIFELAPAPQPIQPRYQWQTLFPDYMPVVGSIVTVNSVFVKGYGYSSMERLRLTSIVGEFVSGIVMGWQGREWIDTNKVMNCELSDLWPCMFVKNMGLPVGT